MARYAKVSGLKTRAYPPREGKVELMNRKMAVPKMSQDELNLRLGIPDGLETGSGRHTPEIPHNPSYSEKQRRFFRS